MDVQLPADWLQGEGWTLLFAPSRSSHADPQVTIAIRNIVHQYLFSATETDEGPYTCRVKNDAGENSFDIKLLVHVPPKIIMLEKEKNKTVIENQSVTLSCPATGKPEPDISWFKDGQAVHVNNIETLIPSGELNGNELKILRIKESDSGRYTCEADNVAGSAEQDINLNVISK